MSWYVSRNVNAVRYSQAHAFLQTRDEAAHVSASIHTSIMGYHSPSSIKPHMEGDNQWGRHERVQSDILQGRTRCLMPYQALTARPVNAAHTLSLLSEPVGAC